MNKKCLYGLMGEKGIFDGNKNGLFDYFRKTEKPLKYTYGFLYKSPTTCLVPVTAEEAIVKFENAPFIEVYEFDDYIHVNAYSENDMW